MTEPKVTDLAALDTVAGSNDGFDVPIKHPATGDDLGITIRVLGRDSDTFRKIQTAQNRKRLNRLMKAGRAKSADALPQEEIEADAIALLVACTTGWSGVVIRGQALDFTPENVEEVYSTFPWIREQVDEAIGDRANFTKG